jgi:hypothetical protein
MTVTIQGNCPSLSRARDAPKRLPKRNADEKKEQDDFANWLSLQNSRLRFTTKGSCLSFAHY